MREIILDRDGDLCLRLTNEIDYNAPDSDDNSDDSLGPLPPGPHGSYKEREEMLVKYQEAPKHTPDIETSTLHLIVSSKVLPVASPVFKAMFMGPFMEGIELSQRNSQSSGSPYPLDLSEDDPEAMLILCGTLHQNLDHVPKRPSARCLEAVAFLVNKYQCPHALRYAGRQRLADGLAGSFSGGGPKQAS